MKDSDSAPSNRPAGDSTEQREVEEFLVARLAENLGYKLAKKKFELPRGELLEIDGFCDSPPTLCEAWAHQGPAKSAQKNKVMADAFKLLFAEQIILRSARKILLFGNQSAAAHFTGSSWMGRSLEAKGIEVQVIELRETLKETILRAQKRQYR